MSGTSGKTAVLAKKRGGKTKKAGRRDAETRRKSKNKRLN